MGTDPRCGQSHSAGWHHILRRPFAWLPVLLCLLVLVDLALGRPPDAQALPGPKPLSLSASAAIVATVNDQIRPALTYASPAGVYLAVWEDHWLGPLFGADVNGRRVSTSGSPMGDVIQINYEGHDTRLAPRVAYNSGRGEFLVVWEYEYSAVDHDIYAQRLTTDGSLIGGSIGVSTMGSYESNPAIVYNWVDDEYFVVWENRIGADEFTHREIVGRRLASLGIPTGGQFVIATGSLDKLAPDVAHSGGSDQYLVVWQDKQAGAQFDIYGQRVGYNGALLGSPIPISTWEYDQLKPRLAYNGLDNQFLVVWEDHHWGWGAIWDIYGQRVSGLGALLGGNFGISWEDLGGAQRQRLSPAVAYMPGANEYLVAFELVWTDSDHDVYCRRVDASGALLAGDAVVSNLGSWEGEPAVGADYNGNYLLAWDDYRDAASQGINIYAGMVQLPATPTPTATPSRSSTATGTATATPTRTGTPTATATETATSTPSRTSTTAFTATGTATATPTRTSTPTPSATSTQTPASTPSATPTATAMSTHTPTATRNATPTATPTAAPVNGQVRGRVILERRTSNAGASVCLGSQCTVTGNDGRFIISGLTPGVYTATVTHASYLRTQRTVTVPVGLISLPDVTLLGGDIVQDGRIELADLNVVSQSWNGVPGSANWDERADVTDDGIVNVLDAVAIQFNWDKTAPGPWP